MNSNRAPFGAHKSIKKKKKKFLLFKKNFWNSSKSMQKTSHVVLKQLTLKF